MGVELGITAGAYAKIERGETDPSATRLLKIAEILGVDVNTFFHDVQPGLTRLEEPAQVYGTASKKDIEELKALFTQMTREMAHIKSEVAGLKKKATATKKR